MDKNDRKATIIDISQKTGYSIATVSRALNNFPNVKEATKKKILEISKSLNYIPNVAAKHLVKGKSKIIGLLLPDRSGIYNDFIDFLYKDLLKRGYNILIYNSNDESSKQSFNIEQLLMQQVDGLIFSPIPGDYKILERIISLNVPCMVVNRFVRDYPVDHVLFDFRKGISEAVDFLVARGRKHFYQFVRQDVYNGFERRNAFNFSLKVNNLTCEDSLTIPVDDSFESGYEQAKILLERHVPVDVIFCSSDLSAVGVIRAALDAGVRVPEDLAVVGSYDCAVASYANPRVSTIRADFSKMSQAVTERMLKIINEGHSHTENLSIDTSFVARDTT
ncbi:MAG: LacI family DNA-binding transcriptional regulator [Spirochaetia bacterium]|nr:LacI family DNA-binding transcriptional regulator [Spirochaetia bacterium]